VNHKQRNRSSTAAEGNQTSDDQPNLEVVDGGQDDRGALDFAIDPGPEFEHLTDVGNAARLVDRHGSRLRWVHGPGWMKWNGTVWVVDPLEPHRSQIDTIRHYRKTEGGLLEPWLKDSEDRSRINAAVELAKPFVPLDVDALDADPWLLNVRNGTLDLHSGELQPHRAENLLTRLADVDYQPNTSCPTFDAFVDRIFVGDRDLIGYVQRALGYSVIGTTSEQKLFVCTGSGSNGKSTLLELIRDILGTYARAIPASSLLHAKGHNPRYELASLPGVRFVTAVESDVDKRLAEGLVKSITGSDTISARQIYNAPFTFRPQLTLWLATNHLPHIEGTDHAIWRRLKVIPFDVTIPDDEQDQGLPMKLLAEAPGVLAWLVEGCRAYNTDGLGEPEAVTAAVTSFRESQDTVGQWITDRIELGEGAWTSTKELVDSYNQWADANAMDGITGVALGKKLADHGPTPKKQYGKRGWTGIRVLPLTARGDASV